MAVADDDTVSAAPDRPCGYAQHTSISAVKNLNEAPSTGKTLAQCKGKPNRALIQAEAQGIRWTDDPDVDPSASVGMVIAAGQTVEYTGDLSRFRMIQAAGGAIANVSFYNS